MSLLKGVPVGLLGTGICLPPKVLTNEDLEKMVETTDQWIVERTGIRTRHVADEGMVTTDLAEEASRKALAAAGVAPEELDLILVGTNSPDTLFPCVAAKLQGRLGATKAGASDIQSGCTGSVYAFAYAAAGIASGLFRHVLVVGAEVLSRLVDWTDRNTCILFGDGAGAAVLGAGAGGPGPFPRGLPPGGRHEARAHHLPWGAGPASRLGGEPPGGTAFRPHEGQRGVQVRQPGAAPPSWRSSAAA